MIVIKKLWKKTQILVVMSNRVIYLIILYMLFTNCRETISKEEASLREILTFMIEGTAKPIAYPPPKSNLSEKEKIEYLARKEKYEEKWKIETINIAVYNTMVDYSFKEYYVDEYCEFQKLFNLNSGDKTINFELDISKKYHIDFVDDLRRKDRDWDMLYSFSRVKFNSSYTKALLSMNFRSSSRLYLLEKIEGKWEVKYFKVLSII